MLEDGYGVLYEDMGTQLLMLVVAVERVCWKQAGTTVSAGSTSAATCLHLPSEVAYSRDSLWQERDSLEGVMILYLYVTDHVREHGMSF